MQDKRVPAFVTVFRIQGPFLFGGLDKLSAITDQLATLRPDALAADPLLVRRLRRLRTARQRTRSSQGSGQ